MRILESQEKTEKIEKFTEKKTDSLVINKILADYYKNNDEYQRKANKIFNCASYLLFRKYFDPEDTKKLISANFCNHPLCLMCAWRLHLKKVFVLQEALDKLKQDYPDINLYFLNLTVKNWSSIDKSKLQDLERKVVRFIRKTLKVADYYCSLEISISKLEDLPYHPHMHCIIATTKELGTCLSDIRDLRCIWSKVYGDYNYGFLELTLYPIRENSVNEVTKYILKPERKITSEYVISIAKAIKGVKKTFSSGLIRRYYREAKNRIEGKIEAENTILEKFLFSDEFYKWLNNKYLLQSLEE